jgi:hypothetical protein
MSWNRMNEDSQEMWTDLRQSTGPGTYALSRPMKCSVPFVEDPQLSSQGVQVSICADRPLVDVDSELMGITRRAVKCPQGLYSPGSGGCKLSHPQTDSALDSKFEPEDTRSSNPGCTLRGTGWNRFEWLCEDPQRFAELPFETDVNNRLIVKDTHRPLIPRPMYDQGAPEPRPCGAPVNRSKVVGLDELPPLPMRPHWRTCQEVALIKGSGKAVGGDLDAPPSEHFAVV